MKENLYARTKSVKSVKSVKLAKPDKVNQYLYKRISDSVIMSSGRISLAFSCCRCYECKLNNCFTTEIGEHDDRDAMLIPYGIYDIDNEYLKKYVIEDAEDSDDSDDYEFYEDEMKIPSKYEKLSVCEEIYNDKFYSKSCDFISSDSGKLRFANVKKIRREFVEDDDY